MPIKVKTSLKVLKKFNEDVKKEFKEELTNGAVGYELVRTIQDIIKKGLSPVDGVGRFERYSDSYRSAIKKNVYGANKRPSPVSMFLSGEMLGSLRLVTKNRKLYVEFEDKKAFWHQYGKGNLPVRKLLPTRMFDRFNKRINQIILKALKVAVAKK